MPTVYTSDQYEAFEQEMHESFPLIFSARYGGFCTGAGWWHIIKSLCHNIQGHIDARNRTREVLLAGNPYNVKIPDEIEQVVIEQVKEKFGALRIYYRGGDDAVAGMVRIAEAWSCHTCETCGQPGERRVGGWVRTLCDHHEAEYQNRLVK